MVGDDAFDRLSATPDSLAPDLILQLMLLDRQVGACTGGAEDLTGRRASLVDDRSRDRLGNHAPGVERRSFSWAELLFPAAIGTVLVVVVMWVVGEGPQRLGDGRTRLDSIGLVRHTRGCDRRRRWPPPVERTGSSVVSPGA